jgi:hypothetical protein
MPYISAKDRQKFYNFLNAMCLTDVSTPGELNYLITCLVQHYLANTERKYQHFNDAVGALEGAKLELYRRAISPYEDRKIEENGDVLNEKLVTSFHECHLPDCKHCKG